MTSERDPAEVRREIRWRRAAATFLFHKLNGNEEGQAAAMQLVLTECAAYQVQPSTVLLESIVLLVNDYVVGTARDRLLEALRTEMTMYYGVSGP